MQNQYFVADEIRERLKKLNWIPKNDHEIRNKKVFVFEKLARLTTTRIKGE